MRAVRLVETGPPEVLRVVELDPPRPAIGQVVIRVAVAGVNLLDTLHRSGRSPLPLPTGLGVEGAGTVVEVGEGVTDRRVGDRVAWHRALGSYAQRVAMDVSETVLLDDGVDEVAAAAVLHQGMTAHYLTHATTRPGREDTVLVHAAAGGVGHLLVQLAVGRGARVLACTSTAGKAARVRRLGADAVLLYDEDDLVTAVRRLTGGRGVDVVYDSLGRRTFAASLDCLRPRGTLVAYGTTTGPIPPVDPQVLADKGSLFLTRPSMDAYTSSPIESAWHSTAVLDLVGSGALQVDVQRRYPLDEAARAHADLASGSTSGKLLIDPWR